MMYLKVLHLLNYHRAKRDIMEVPFYLSWEKLYDYWFWMYSFKFKMSPWIEITEEKIWKQMDKLKCLMDKLNVSNSFGVSPGAWKELRPHQKNYKNFH